MIVSLGCMKLNKYLLLLRKTKMSVKHKQTGLFFENLGDILHLSTKK